MLVFSEASTWCVSKAGFAPGWRGDRWTQTVTLDIDFIMRRRKLAFNDE
jgi:hypothetical protein